MEILRPLALRYFAFTPTDRPIVHVLCILVSAGLCHVVCKSRRRHISQQEGTERLSHQNAFSALAQSVSLICLQSCVHPPVVFKCLGAEWHPSNLMAERHRVDSRCCCCRCHRAWWNAPCVCARVCFGFLPSFCTTSSHFHASLSF